MSLSSLDVLDWLILSFLDNSDRWSVCLVNKKSYEVNYPWVRAVVFYSADHAFKTTTHAKFRLLDDFLLVKVIGEKAIFKFKDMMFTCDTVDKAFILTNLQLHILSTGCFPSLKSERALKDNVESEL